jgi:hypothetical protein
MHDDAKIDVSPESPEMLSPFCLLVSMQLPNLGVSTS